MRSTAPVVAAVLIGVSLAGGAVRAGWFAPDPADPKVTLAEVEKWVSGRYPTSEIGSEALAALMARDGAVLLDVREPAEFDASHIAGAVRVSPGADAAAIAAAAGARAEGRAVVLYCSVGARSGAAARVAAKALTAAGATGVYNLTGGVFRWAGEARELVDANGPTRAVHPYDASWGKLLQRHLAGARPDGR